MKWLKSSPSDSVAEVNTQAQRRECTSAWNRAAMSYGIRLSEKPRGVTSTARAPSIASTAAIRSRLAAISPIRPQKGATELSSPNPARRICSMPSAPARSDTASSSDARSSVQASRPGLVGRHARSCCTDSSTPRSGSVTPGSEQRVTSTCRSRSRFSIRRLPT